MAAYAGEGDGPGMDNALVGNSGMGSRFGVLVAIDFDELAFIDFRHGLFLLFLDTLRPAAHIHRRGSAIASLELVRAL